MSVDAGFESWLGDAEELSHFEFIQYSRGLFPLTMPEKCLLDLCQSFPRRIREWQEDLKGESSRFFVQDFHGVKFYTDEVDLGQGWKFFVLFTEGRLTLLAAAYEEEYQARLRSAAAHREWAVYHGEEMPGIRQKPLMEFLRLMYLYMVRHPRTCTARTFLYIFQKSMDYVLDDIQLTAVESSDDADLSNIFVSGCAGSGKSSTGFQWLVMHPMKQAKRICLTFSESQRKQYEDWQEREDRIRKTCGAEESNTVRCSRWFDFLLEHARPYLDRGIYALNSEQSYAVFYEICGHLPSVFLKTVSGESKREKEFFLWEEIHGLIKGAMFRREARAFSEPLTRRQYSELKSFHMGKQAESVLSGQGIAMLFQLYERYEEYLASHRFLDDNDIARIVMRHLDEILGKEEFERYDLAFLDDCQELTEIQMQAVFSLLPGCLQKFMAVDRCQMLQPTWFHTGFAQKLAENLSPEGEETFSERYRLPKQYRSLLELMRFQGSILDEIKSARNLTGEDAVPAVFADQDLREGRSPVWIVDSDENRDALQSMLEKLLPGDIYVLHAMPLRAGERDGKHFSLMECKGISIASAVLLWNLFSGAVEYVGESHAWEYFYMGAVRPERYLIFLEREEGSIGPFLQQLSERGIIEKCESLSDRNADGILWTEAIRQGIAEAAEESVLEEAYHLYLHEEYEMALSLYRQYPEQRETASQSAVCEGKLAEKRADFGMALEWYMSLAENSVTICHCICELIEQPELSPELRFASQLALLGHPEGSFRGNSALYDIYTDYRSHQGFLKLNALLRKTFERYPGLRGKVTHWVNGVWDQMDSYAVRMNDTMDRKAEWRLS